MAGPASQGQCVQCNVHTQYPTTINVVSTGSQCSSAATAATVTALPAVTWMRDLSASLVSAAAVCRARPAADSELVTCLYISSISSLLNIKLNAMWSYCCINITLSRGYILLHRIALHKRVIKATLLGTIQLTCR